MHVRKMLPPPSKGGVATSYGDTELRKIHTRPIEVEVSMGEGESLV